MDDLSHWDFADEFSAMEAAALIMGIDPSREIIDEKVSYPKSKPILERLSLSYHLAWGYWHTRSDGCFEFNEGAAFPNDAIQSVDMERFQNDIAKHGISEKFAEHFDRWIGHGTSQDGEFSALQIQKFSRVELVRWLSAIGMKSVYKFDVRKDSTAPTEIVQEDKPLAPRERDTLLKLVIGMAIKGYTHNPAASKSTAPKEIADDLAALGIDITDDTVRKYLKQAADTVLPPKPRQQ